MDRFNFGFEVKSVDESGVFEGYGAVFGNRDLGGDIIEPGAFSKSLKARGSRGVKMLLDHDSTKRIGVWEHLSEDQHGLLVKGRLLTQKQVGAETYIDLKEGAIDGLSMGGRVKSDAYDGRKRARILKEIDLLEISLVSFPMNESARVTAVKSLADMTAKDFRDLEAALRDEGLSRSEAVKAVACFKSWSRRDGVASDETTLRDEAGAEIEALIKRNIEILKS